MQEYFIVLNEQKKGAFTLEELKTMGLSPTTLVWKEGMTEWEEARQFPELNDMITKSVPPPIPKAQKTLKVEAEITQKKKAHIIKPRTQITFAKEVKTNFIRLCIALAIGGLSYPYVYIFENGPGHSSMIENWKGVHVPTRDQEVSGDMTEKQKELELRSRRLGWNPFYWTHYDGLVDFHRRRLRGIEDQQEKTFGILSLLVASVLILGRYLLMFVRWIQRTSLRESIN